jgi:dipeptidyl aminopeptidase/acylaminoacyl peptidase
MTEKNEVRTVKPEDLYCLKALQDAVFSPDGKTVVYSLAEVDAEKEVERVALWRLTLETGETRQMTVGLANDSAPAFSPDGKQLAFLSTRDEKPQIYVIPIDGGEARQLTNMKQGAGNGPVWSPDGTHIAFTAGKDADPPESHNPYRVTRRIYRFDGMGYLGNNLLDIYIIPAAGGEPKQLTDSDTFDNSPVWSPDGKEILYLSNFHPDSYNFWPSLKAVNLQGETRDILKDWAVVLSAAWTTDGKQIVFSGTPNDIIMKDKIELWVVDQEGGQPESRSAGLQATVSQLLIGDFPVPLPLMGGRSIFIPDGSTQAYTVAQDGGKISVFKIALTGPESCVPIINGDFSCTLMDMHANQLLYAVSSHTIPRDLFITDMDGKNEKQLTHINAELMADWNLPSVEQIVYPNPHGEQIEGWLMKPVTGEPPYPTILYIHGGPHGAFGHIFHADFQILAGAGYAVFFANPHGSSGYGNDFTAKIIGRWGEKEYEDLMAGIDLLIDKGIADPDQMGVCGLSYGGFMTSYIVGQTDRFKAAVPENPVINLVSWYGTGDIGPAFFPGEMGGLPQDIPDVYRRCSPITHAHKCTTPTLLVLGEADYRCPAGQSEEFYAVLKVNGCVVEMLRLPDSPHVAAVSGPVCVRKAQNEALLDWMNRYVKGEAK